MLDTVSDVDCHMDAAMRAVFTLAGCKLRFQGRQIVSRCQQVVQGNASHQCYVFSALNNYSHKALPRLYLLLG